MNTCTHLLVSKRNIANTRIETSKAVALIPGQARMRIERVALTANNISYAAAGDLLQYWEFFPIDAQWGCVPAWGFATVAESQAEGVAVGERIWGFWPMASELVIEPVAVSPFGFTDGIAHRCKLSQFYNAYQRCGSDPMHAEGQDDAEALLRPLFSASWLINDFIADNQFFGAHAFVLSSASSKTAYGTAFQLFRRGGLRVVGLTAARNKVFVEGLGCYHQVLAYDDVALLDVHAASVYLDYAGAADIRRSVHTHVQDLRYSCYIGASHVDKLGGASELPGPKPIFLFVPTQAAKRVGEWGQSGLNERIGRDWRAFVTSAFDAADSWLVVQQHSGPAAMQAAYALMLSGASDPRRGHILAI